MKSTSRRSKSSQLSSPAFTSRTTSAGPGGAAVAPNHARLPNGTRTGMEALSGFSRDDTRVDSNTPHEAWHNVQQKRGSAQAPVQMKRTFWQWLTRQPETPDPRAGLSPSDRIAYDALQAINQQSQQYQRDRSVVRRGPSDQYATFEDVGRERYAAGRFQDDADRSLQTPAMRAKAEKAKLGSTGVSKLGTLGTHVGQVIGNDTLGTSGRITSGVGGGLGALGSLFEAGVETHDIVTSHDKKKDKAVRSIGLLGTLSNATNSGASAVGQVGSMVSGTGTLSSIASTVAAPAAIAKGGADVITGLATGGLAHYRSNRLEEVENRPRAYAERGIAGFAKDSQWNKAKSNYGKAAGGALGVAGGALLLAAGLSNPIGWALLALGGLAGLGLAGYRMYKKHQQGKKLLQQTDAMEAGGIHVPSDEELGSGGWRNFFKTKSMRRQEAVRGNIAARLAEDEQGNSVLREIGGHLGVSRVDPHTARLLEEQQNKQKMKRARSYARALDY